MQLGIDQTSQMTAWLNRIEESYPNSFEKYGQMVEFIRNNTPTIEQKVKRR